MTDYPCKIELITTDYEYYYIALLPFTPSAKEKNSRFCFFFSDYFPKEMVQGSLKAKDDLQLKVNKMVEIYDELPLRD